MELVGVNGGFESAECKGLEWGLSDSFPVSGKFRMRDGLFVAKNNVEFFIGLF